MLHLWHHLQCHGDRPRPQLHRGPSWNANVCKAEGAHNAAPHAQALDMPEWEQSWIPWPCSPEEKRPFWRRSEQSHLLQDARLCTAARSVPQHPLLRSTDQQSKKFSALLSAFLLWQLHPYTVQRLCWTVTFVYILSPQNEVPKLPQKHSGKGFLLTAEPPQHLLSTIFWNLITAVEGTIS